MIIGKFTSYITNPCKPPDSSSRYYRYIASAHGRQVTGYGSNCETAQKDWERLTSRTPVTLPPAKGGTPISKSSSTTTYQPQVIKGNWISGSGDGNTVAGVSASGRAGAGLTAGASVTATVSDLKAKTNQVVSDVLPDSIEDPIENAGIPLWMLPVGIVGAGLLLILMLRR